MKSDETDFLRGGVPECLVLGKDFVRGGRAAVSYRDGESGLLYGYCESCPENLYEVWGQGRDTESRLEAQGLVVAADGLVMFSNLPLNPEKLMGQDGGGGEDGGQRFGMKITPTSFKVTFGREEKEYPAYLVATDSKLDLAFVKIEDLGGRKVLPIAFDTSSTVLIGQEVLYITRLSKGYDLRALLRHSPYRWRDP